MVAINPNRFGARDAQPLDSFMGNARDVVKGLFGDSVNKSDMPPLAQAAIEQQERIRQIAARKFGDAEGEELLEALCDATMRRPFTLPPLSCRAEQAQRYSDQREGQAQTVYMLLAWIAEGEASSHHSERERHMRNPHDQSVLHRNLSASANPVPGSIVGLVGRYGAPRIHLQGDPPAPALPATPPAAPAAPASPPSPGVSPSAPGAQPPADGPQAYRPEGLPDHLFGKSDKETIDKLHTTVAGFRKSQGDVGAVPDKPEGYTFEPSEKLAPYLSNFDKDPVYMKAREIAREAGMTDKVFKTFIPGLLEHFVEGGLVAAPVDDKAMLRGLAPADLGADATDADREVAGGKRVQDNIAWADGAKANKAIPDDIADYLVAGAADNPATNKLIEWLRGSNGEMKPAMGGAGGSGLSEDALQARIVDERGDPNSPKFDRAFATETDRLAKQHYG